MRILVLPIDARPCNMQFLDHMSRWARSQCIFPEASELDDFKRPADFEANVQFLEREIPGADAAVISLDHWCYGGLLASREDFITTEEALRRIDVLKQILRQWRDTPVYMSTVIMRSTISALSIHDLDIYHAMADYSVYADKYNLFHREEDLQKLKEAESKVPSAIMQKVMRVRDRNLQVNLEAVSMAAEGLLASLSVLQEDSQYYGLPKKDQRTIQKHITETHAQHVFLRNGTDEAGALSMAQALWCDRPPRRVNIVYLGQKDFIAPYEDRLFPQNLESACDEIGIANDPTSPITLCVVCPEKGEQEESDVPANPTFVQECAEHIDHFISEGHLVYLLDIVRANGGCKELLNSIQHADKLAGYSAWNTASNAMGTLLAQILTDSIRGKANHAYSLERMMDDYLYQTWIKPALNAQLTEAGDDVYNLHHKDAAIEALREAYQKMAPEHWPLQEMPKYEVTLPWPRTFEVQVDIPEA